MKSGGQHERYHGMRYVRHFVTKLIPKNIKCYTEPFAGHAWVAREVCKNKNIMCILGDINPEPLKWAEKHHKFGENVILKIQDWKKTISKDCINVLDPPHEECVPVQGIRPGRCSLQSRNFFHEIKQICDKGYKCLVNLPNENSSLYNEIKQLYCNDPKWKCIPYIYHQNSHHTFRYLIAKNF